MNPACLRFLSYFAFLVISAACLRAPAADRFWTNGLGGNFAGAVNWSGSLAPGLSDNANFAIGGAYTVSFTNSATNANAFFNGTGNLVIFNIGASNRWRLTDSFVVGQNAANTAAVQLVAGALVVTNSAGTGRLVVGQNGHGVFLLSGGAVVADQLFVTNNSSTNFTNSIFSLNSGALTTLHGSTVTQATDFVIGTVSNQTATWNMLGGTNFIGVGTNSFGFDNYIVLGGANGAVGAVVVDGAGTVWTNRGIMRVGSGVDNNKLTVTNGGTVITRGLEFGANSGSSGNSLLVTGAGSLLSNQIFELDLGEFGSTNQARVTAGGRLVTSQIVLGGHIGNAPGGTNNSVVVDGSNSVLSATSFGGTGNSLPFGGVTVGQGGASNLLIVTNGALLQTFSAVIGSSSNAHHNSLILSGNGSVWSNVNSGVTVGAFGASNRLVIENGAKFLYTNGATSSFFTIGDGGTADANLVSVTGPGSRMTVGSFEDMRLGVVGSANLLIVSNGGFLDTSGVSIGSTGVSNLAIVTGTNSVWTNGTATIGDNSDGNGVIVSNGGTAFGFAVLGNSTNASSNFLLVTGSNSVFNGGVDVGFQGAGNRLVVSNGGTVRSSSATVGVLATASNNLAIVTGAGSLWSNASSVDIGESGSGSVLLVSNGGVFAVNGNVLLGATTSSINNRIVVDGGTLRATNPAGTASLNLRRGTNQFNAGVIDVNQLVMTNSNGSFEFNGGTLITRGAFISNGVLFAVGAAGATPAVWDVRAGASPNVLAGQLRIGSNTSFNQLLITNGALLTSSSFGVIGLSNGANSNLVLVSGTGSRWLMGNNLLVGDGGAFNRLVVSNGALVGNVDGQVGFTTTSSNNEALVTGAGSLWSNQSGLFVGFAGGGSRVVVSNGGTVFASNGVFVGLTTNSTNNRLIVDGGTLRAANPAGGGVLDVRRGTNVLNAGLIDVNGLLVTNVLGIFEFNGGTLVTGNTTNNNGRIFTVGNGTSAATLQLNGGTHAFSNNLVIASNASLIGAGTIVGNVTNFGGFSAGTSPGSLGINGSLFLQPSARMTFEIGGLFPTNQYDVIAVTNFVEFAGTLSLSFINNFLPAPTNSFTLVSFASSSGSFTNAPNGGRVNLTNNLASFSANYTGTTFVLGNVQYVDSDGDGQGDLQEQAAGTNPNESSVYLEVTSITQNASNHIVIQFQSVSGKNYRIEHTTNFNSGFTGLIASPSLTAPATNISQWIDDGSLTGGLPVGQRYYRIGLQP